MKSFLQHAAILSQLVEHSSALTQAIKAKEGLKLAASSLYSFISQKSKKEDCPTWNSSLEVMLEKFIYEITNRDPTNASNQTSYKTDMILKHQTSGIIFWKHNPRNNEKYLKKELAKRYGENFKGKKMQAIWLEEFNIGNIMHLNPVLLKELEEEDLALSDILNEEKLVELVLVYSCCLFSVATENRFICHKELETDKKSNELNGPVNIVAKNYQLLQNNNFRQS